MKALLSSAQAREKELRFMKVGTDKRVCALGWNTNQNRKAKQF